MHMSLFPLTSQVEGMRNLTLAICLAAAVLLSACSERSATERTRAVYYWSTVLDVDTVKQAFLKAHGVRRMYVRYFDVVPGDGGRPCPTPRCVSRPPCPRGWR